MTMEKFSFSRQGYIVIRRSDGYVYADFGKFNDFLPSDKLGGKRIKVYSSHDKTPSWVQLYSDEYEIKKVAEIIEEID